MHTEPWLIVTRLLVNTITHLLWCSIFFIIILIILFYHHIYNPISSLTAKHDTSLLPYRQHIIFVTSFLWISHLFLRTDQERQKSAKAWTLKFHRYDKETSTTILHWITMNMGQTKTFSTVAPLLTRLYCIQMHLRW